MIRRVGEPERVTSPTGRMCTWRVPLADSPSRAWRHGFLDRACELGLFFDSRIRIEGAVVFFDLEQSSLQVGLERIEECIREENKACGYEAEEIAAWKRRVALRHFEKATGFYVLAVKEKR